MFYESHFSIQELPILLLSLDLTYLEHSTVLSAVWSEKAMACQVRAVF